MAQGSAGRPRSETARRAILESARDLLSEIGYERLTITAIAERSGSGRQTIYRWWTSKARIIADLVVEGDLVLPAQSIPDTGSLESDLTAWLAALIESMNDPTTAAVLRALVTAASEDETEARTALLDEHRAVPRGTRRAPGPRQTGWAAPAIGR